MHICISSREIHRFPSNEFISIDWFPYMNCNSVKSFKLLDWNGDHFHHPIVIQHGVITHQTHSVHLWQPAPSRGWLSHSMGLVVTMFASSLLLS
jgi:hypothetical protein